MTKTDIRLCRGPDTGARRGELLNLRWKDVDLDDKHITITGSTAVVSGQRIDGTTKSGRTRVVTIDSETVAVLSDHRRQRLHDWLGLTSVPDTVTALMSKIIKAHNERSGADRLTHARLHDLRHFHATTLLLAGVPVHVVAARLGHADPSVTLRVYAHVIRSAETLAADIFAQAIRAHKGPAVSKSVSKRPRRKKGRGL